MSSGLFRSCIVQAHVACISDPCQAGQYGARSVIHWQLNYCLTRLVDVLGGGDADAVEVDVQGGRVRAEVQPLAHVERVERLQQPHPGLPLQNKSA